MGLLSFRKKQEDKFIEIGHADDLVNVGIEIPPRKELV